MSYFARTTYNGNGSQTAFNIGFPYQFQQDVAVYKYPAGGNPGFPLVLGLDYTFTSSGTITMSVAPANGYKLDIRRQTKITSLDNTMAGGGSVRASEVVQNDQQMEYLIQEGRDTVGDNTLAIAAEVQARTTGDNNLQAQINAGIPGVPGGNIMAIGLFVAANLLLIPLGTDLVRTSGYGVLGWGAADYIADNTVGGNTTTTFVSANGRGFRLRDEQDLNVTMFGVHPANSAATNGVAFDAVVAHNRANIITTGNNTFGPGGNRYDIPIGIYNTDRGVEHFDQIWLEGRDCGYSGGGTSCQINFPANAFGWIFHSNNTLGVAGTRAPDGHSAAGSIVRNIYMHGGYVHGATAEGEYHGIMCRAPCIIEQVWCNVFQGDGFHIYDSIGSGGATEGNGNTMRIQNCAAWGCRDGALIVGADANAGHAIGFSNCSNRRWGVFENSFLGNFHAAHHTSDNGIALVGSGIPYTQTERGGNRYSVVFGQDAGASVNPPSGTTADNAYWIYLGGGGAVSFCPSWFSGIAVRAGGAYFNGSSLMDFCYAEGGQGASQINGTGILAYGLQGTTTRAFNGGSVKTRVVGGGGAEQWTNAFRITGQLPNFSGPLGIEMQMIGGGGKIEVYDRNAAAYGGLTLGGSQIDLTLSGTVVASWLASGIHFTADKGVLGVNTGPPGAGAHAQGEIVYNAIPAGGGRVGWVCVAAGTPGSWKAFGAIDA